MSNNDLRVFTGNANPELARKICGDLNISLGEALVTAFSDGDPITRGGDRALQAAIPGARGQPHTTITGAGHFLQEDRGPELARVVIDFVAST